MKHYSKFLLALYAVGVKAQNDYEQALYATNDQQGVRIERRNSQCSYASEFDNEQIANKETMTKQDVEKFALWTKDQKKYSALAIVQKVVGSDYIGMSQADFDKLVEIAGQHLDLARKERGLEKSDVTKSREELQVAEEVVEKLKAEYNDNAKFATIKKNAKSRLEKLTISSQCTNSMMNITITNDAKHAIYFPLIATEKDSKICSVLTRKVLATKGGESVERVSDLCLFFPVNQKIGDKILGELGLQFELQSVIKALQELNQEGHYDVVINQLEGIKTKTFSADKEKIGQTIQLLLSNVQFVKTVLAHLKFVAFNFSLGRYYSSYSQSAESTLLLLRTHISENKKIAATTINYSMFFTLNQEKLISDSTSLRAGELPFITKQKQERELLERYKKNGTLSKNDGQKLNDLKKACDKFKKENAEQYEILKDLSRIKYFDTLTSEDMKRRMVHVTKNEQEIEKAKKDPEKYDAAKKTAATPQLVQKKEKTKCGC